MQSLTHASYAAAFSSRDTLRAREFFALGFSRTQIARAAAAGEIERVGRGIYRLSGDAEVSENQTLIEVATRVPAGVVCLLSALRFHRITTQNPHEVWLALPAHAWRPRLDFVKIRVSHFSSASLANGIEEHTFGGRKVRVFSAAKTVADCFKFRGKVGEDVACEALRECVRNNKATPAEIFAFAKINRVSKIIQPYINSLF
jgi:predicted transcriptional regulator of viral defense system